MLLLRRLTDHALAPLAGVPGRCAVCRGWDTAAVCADCVRRHAAARPRCARCAIEVPAAASVCGACLKAPPAFGRAYAAVAYDHPWDGLVVRFKFGDALDLAGALAARLLAALPPADGADAAAVDLVLPVPLAAQRLRERGYNQAWELARRVARRRRLDADPLLLVRTRDTAHQTDLPPARRAANVRGAFGVDARRAHRARRPPRRGRRRRDDHRRHPRRGGACPAARRRRRGRGLGRRAHAASRRRLSRPLRLPTVFHIVLVQPEIPPNTGNVIRLAANTGCTLHLVEPLGFSMDDRLLRRAGLDYHEYAEVRRHASWPAFLDRERPAADRLHAFTTRGVRRHDEVAWRPGDWLLFGSESAGLPAQVRDGVAAGLQVRLPMRTGQRSLNLSNVVAVAVFEAWRQQGWHGAA